MDRLGGYHTKQSKSGRERQIPCDITHMWNLKCDTNKTYLSNRNRLTDREQTCGFQAESGVGEGWTESWGLADANYFI